MTKLLFALAVLVATPRLASADGWIHCSGPDSNCNASHSNGLGAGVGLAMIAGVTYGLGRRRRR